MHRWPRDISHPANPPVGQDVAVVGGGSAYTAVRRRSLAKPSRVTPVSLPSVAASLASGGQDALLWEGPWFI